VIPVESEFHLNQFHGKEITMKNSMDAKCGFRFFAASVAAAVLLGNAAVAQGPETLTRSLVVKYADINLDTTEGVAALYSRIHLAARQVCATPGDSDANLAAYAAKNRCIRESEDRAIGTAHSLALASYYAQKTGRLTTLLAANQSR
jgi:UrcA family protein